MLPRFPRFGLLGGFVFTLLSAPLAAQTATDAKSSDEIIVEGRRTSERYRLPSELRPVAAADLLKPPSAADPRLACNGVGAYGCGTEVLSIVTVRSDGSTQIGATPDER